MATIQEVHSLLDQETKSEFDPTYGIVFDNVNEEQFLSSTSPFLKQKVLLNEFNQFELGSTERRRVYGNLLFYIYVKQGTGSSVKNTLLSKIVSRFANKQYANGLTTLSVTSSAEGTRQNWNVTAVQVPFYFHNF